MRVVIVEKKDAGNFANSLHYVYNCGLVMVIYELMIFCCLIIAIAPAF